MSKRFAVFLVAGLAVAAALVFALLSTTQGAHLRLDGKILKVRVFSQSHSPSSVVMVDFRITNPSDIPFVVNSVKLLLDAAEGSTLAKSDLDFLFENAKVLGPKYNQALTIQDHIAPHQSMDRMAGARFEISEAAVNARKTLRLQIEDVDGVVAEIAESIGENK